MEVATAGTAYADPPYGQSVVWVNANGTGSYDDKENWRFQDPFDYYQRDATDSKPRPTDGLVFSSGATVLFGSSASNTGLSVFYEDGSTLRFQLSGNTLSLTDTFTDGSSANIAGTGTFFLSNGTLNTSGGLFVLGSMNLKTDSGTDLETSLFLLGYNSTANIDGGAKLNSSGSITLGEITPGSTGTAATDGLAALTVESGGVVTANDLLIVGGHANGSITIKSGGSVSSTNGYVGSQVGATGTASVQGTWMNSDFFEVGLRGAGTMTVDGGGHLTTGDGYVGDSGGTGTVTIGSGGQWTVNGNLVLGNDDGSTGNLTVEHGGTLAVTGPVLILGLGEHSKGTLTLADSGTHFNFTGFLGVGFAGTGTLNILRGFTLDQSTQGLLLGGQEQAEGTLHVNGDGSVFKSQSLTLGSLGLGTLKIEDKGFVQTLGDATLGEMDEGVGVATLSGAGSKWQIDGNLIIGENSTGNRVTVNAGAMLVVNGDHITLGQEKDSAGTLTLNGADAKLTGTASLEIGRHGDGTLEVMNGATLVLPSTTLGAQSDGSGTITVDGTNSKVTNTGSFTVGGASTGTLNITGGGEFLVDQGAAIVGRNQDAIGHVTVSGLNSRWTINAPGDDIFGDTPGNLVIGSSGTGTVEVSDHAKLSVGSLALGFGAKGTGVLTIIGNGGTDDATLSVTTALTVGDSGHGTLILKQGAKLENASLKVEVGYSSNSIGEINVDGGKSLLHVASLELGPSGGDGRLTVTDGGQVTVDGLLSAGQAGLAGTGTGSIGVSGQAAPSVLTVATLALYKPSPDFPALAIGAGGQVIVTGTGGDSKSFFIGNAGVFPGQAGASASVDGVGAQLTVSGVTSILGSLSIDAGGAATLQAVNVFSADDQAKISVGGTASTTSTLTVSGPFKIGDGKETVGTLDIGDGGLVRVISPGSLSSDGGQIEVHGSGARLLIEHQILILDGGAMTVRNGGTVSSTNGLQIQDEAVVSVTGPGSELKFGTVHVGSGSETGRLLADSNGHVAIASELDIDPGGTVNTRGGGSIDIGATSGQAIIGHIEVHAGGRLKDNGVILGTVYNFGGVVGGKGIVNGSLISSGMTVVGDPQTFTITGDFEQRAGGVLVMAVGGTNPADTDHLVVGGKATLGGYLELDFINGFAPTTGELFDLLQFASTAGQFENVIVTGLAPGWKFSLDPTSSTLSLASESNAIAMPEFVVHGGPNTVLTGGGQITPGENIHFVGGILEATSNTNLTNPVILDLNGGTFQADTGTVSTLGGVLSGPGIFTKSGLGALTLTAANTYTGNTYLTAGSLFVDGSLASPNVFVSLGALLGGNGTYFGNLFNAGTVSPGHSPGHIQVNGNYTQSSTGLLKIEIAGLDLPQHDLLSVGGAANLDGALQLVRLDKFKLKRNEPMAFLTAAGGVNGKFSTVLSNFTTDTILEPTVVYHANSVALEAVQGSFGKFADGWGLSPNQKSVARGLDSLPIDRRTNALFDYLDYRQLTKLPGDFDKIAPEELTSMFTIATSLAQVQSQNLQRRTDDIRSGASGFSASGLAVNGAGPSYSGSFGGTNGVAGPTGKDSKDEMEVADFHEDPRLGVFLSGTGEWVSVGSTDNARGYDLTSGGFTLGVDYKVTPNFAVGVMAGYTGSSADLADRGRVYVNGGKIGLYATLFQNVQEAPAPTMPKDASKETPTPSPSIAKGFYADLAINGGYNSYDTRRSALQGEARGDTSGGELNALLGTGYDFKKGGLTFGPTATFNYTYLGTGNYTERGSLAPLDIHGGKGESLRTALGFKVSYDWKVGGVLLKPEIRAAWQHEYGDAVYSLNSSFANGGGDSFAVSGPKIGRDSALLGAGVAVEFNERCSAYLYYDGDLGRKSYQSTSVTGGVRFAF